MHTNLKLYLSCLFFFAYCGRWRCLTDALPEECHSFYKKGVCSGRDFWNQTAHESCLSQDLEIRSISTVSKCGTTGLFSSVHYVCCPIPEHTTNGDLQHVPALHDGATNTSDTDRNFQLIKTAQTDKTDIHSGHDVVDPEILTLMMPLVNTTAHGASYCMAKNVLGESKYITQFLSYIAGKGFHHGLVYGCQHIDQKLVTRPAWKCMTNDPVQETCIGNVNLIYAWGQNVSPLQLPKDVAFQIGSQVEINAIFVQIFYSDMVQEDNSGISLVLSSEPRKFAAGIMAVAMSYGEVPASDPFAVVNVKCRYTDHLTLHPIGFCVHSHGLGTSVSAWFKSPNSQQVSKDVWTFLGSENPQNPQAFYQMDVPDNITDGSVMSTTCVYNTSGRTEAVQIGPNRQTEEICVFYMMYYAEKTRFHGCLGIDGINPEPAEFLLPGETAARGDLPMLAKTEVYNRSNDTVAALLAKGISLNETDQEQAASEYKPFVTATSGAPAFSFVVFASVWGLATVLLLCGFGYYCCTRSRRRFAKSLKRDRKLSAEPLDTFASDKSGPDVFYIKV